MKKSEIYFSADAWWSVNKYQAKIMGIVPAILFSELLFSRKRFKSEEFFLTAKELEETLGIGEEARRTALKKLIDLGLITITAKGVPKRYFYRINDERLDEIMAAARDEETPTLGTSKPSHSEQGKPDTIIKKDINNNIKKEKIEEVVEDRQEKTHEWENPKQFPHLKENFVPKYSIADFKNDIDKKLLLDDALKRFYDVVLKKPYASRKPHLAPQVMERIDPNKCVYSQIWSICYKFPLEDFWKTYNPDIGYLESAWSKLDNIPLPKWMELGYENEYLYEQAHRRPYEPHPFFQERKEAMGGPSATVEQFEEVFSNFDEIFRAKEKEYAKP